MTAVAIIDRDPLSVAENRKLTLLRPMAEPAEIMAVQNATRAFVHQALADGRDYGVIPGTEKKTLLKPGAERVALGFGCYYGDPVIVESEVDHNREVPWRKVKKLYDWSSGKRGKWLSDEVTEGRSLGLYRYVVKVPLVHMETGRTIATGIGVCSTMESKYIDRPRDSENTALKMAHKRAVVAACLMGFGLSDEFTQDLEDAPLATGDGDAPASPRKEAAQAPAEVPSCPVCNGRMWDNREKKTNPKAPDFKCRDRRCDGVVWHLSESKKESAPVVRETMTLAEAKAFTIPRGAAKGNPVDVLLTRDMRAALLWTAENDTEPEFQLALATVLAAREKEEGAAASGASQDSPTGNGVDATTSAPSATPSVSEGARTVNLSKKDAKPIPADLAELKRWNLADLQATAIATLELPAFANSRQGHIAEINAGLNHARAVTLVSELAKALADTPTARARAKGRMGDLPGDPA